MKISTLASIAMTCLVMMSGVAFAAYSTGYDKGFERGVRTFELP